METFNAEYNGAEYQIMQPESKLRLSPIAANFYENQEGLNNAAKTINAFDIDFNGANLGTINGTEYNDIHNYNTLIEAIKEIAEIAKSGGSPSSYNFDQDDLSEETIQSIINYLQNIQDTLATKSELGKTKGVVTNNIGYSNIPVMDVTDDSVNQGLCYLYKVYSNDLTTAVYKPIWYIGDNRWVYSDGTEVNTTNVINNSE